MKIGELGRLGWVTNGLRKYLTRRMVLANLGEICAHGDKSGCGGSAAQFCSKRVFRVATLLGRASFQLTFTG